MVNTIALVLWRHWHISDTGQGFSLLRYHMPGCSAREFLCSSPNHDDYYIVELGINMEMCKPCVCSMSGLLGALLHASMFTLLQSYSTISIHFKLLHQDW